MTGTWKGYYKFDNEKLQTSSGFEKTGFTLDITFFDGKKFKGTVLDDINSGGMQGEGQISGEIKNGQVSFQKQMPLYTIIFKNGTKQTLDRKHPIIYYFGNFSQDKNHIKGKWKFKWKIFLLFGIIPIPFKPSSGTWEMNLQ